MGSVAHDPHRYSAPQREALRTPATGTASIAAVEGPKIDGPTEAALAALRLRLAPHDAQILAALLPRTAKLCSDTKSFEDLAALLVEVIEAGEEHLVSILSRLEYLLDRLDLAGLRRWVLTGLRLYPGDPVRQKRYFLLEDPAAATSLRAEAKGVRFADVQRYLQHYLTGFGLPDTVIKARSAHRLNAPPLRPIVSGGSILLPDNYLALDGEDRSDLYRAAVAHAIAHLRFSPRHQPVGSLKPMSVAIVALLEDARVERLLSREYPGLWSLWGRFHRSQGTSAGLSFESLTSRLSHALHDPNHPDDNHWVNKGRDLFSEIADLDDFRAFRSVASILANDLGQMRVQFNARHYVTEPAYRDDNSFLWDFGDDNPQTSLDETPAEHSAQIQPEDLPEGDTVAHVAPVIEKPKVHYPEWDYRAEIERDRWCTVIEKETPTIPVSAPGRASSHRINRARMAETLRHSDQLNRARRLRRQYEGEDIDLNAAIESRVSLRARSVPDPRIFTRPGRKPCTLALLLLMDLSESTNDRIGGSFDTVLDAQKRAATWIATAIKSDHDRFALHGFASNGRAEVEYYRLKDFAEPFDVTQQQRLAQARGSLSTRMGAAIRHAGSFLDREMAERRCLLVMTDGEPSDIDVSDRRYLIEDAKVAVATLTKRGITVFCLTVDKKADTYVKAIFGVRNYLILEDAFALPAQVAHVVARAAAR